MKAGRDRESEAWSKSGVSIRRVLLLTQIPPSNKDKSLIKDPQKYTLTVPLLRRSLG